MKRKIALFAAALVPLLALAHAGMKNEAVHYRESVMEVMGHHFGDIGKVVKGEKPYDKAAVEQDAAVIEMMSKLPFDSFPPGSDTPESKARPEIWKEPAKFKQDAEKLQDAATKLRAAAQSGDLDAIKKAFGATGQTCKSCHDSFKKR